MRISDWSSDVCSSDLVGVQHDVGVQRELAARSDDAGIVNVQVQLVHGRHGNGEEVMLIGCIDEDLRAAFEFTLGAIGRASCRERVCKKGVFSVIVVSEKNKNKSQHRTIENKDK